MLETSERVCNDCGEPITDDSEFCRWCGSYSPTSVGSTITAGIGAQVLGRGHRLGGYVIEGLLARGAMGMVYRARDEALDRSVAIKVVAPEFAGDRDLRRRFEQEAVAAARIEHPGILPVYAVGEEQGVVFIVSRLVEGPNLKTLVGEKGALRPAQVADLVNQLGLAIDAAHAGGVLHRDIKPANVLLASGRTGSYHAYLADFGLSKLIAHEAGLTRSGEVVGTADYLAPEQIQRGRIDERTDLYALGCLAYYCLNGRPPFRRGTVPATMWAHLHEDPPELAVDDGESVPLLEKALEKAVAKDPDQRFANGAAFGRALSDAVSSPSSAEAAGERTGKPSARAAVSKPKVRAKRSGAVAAASSDPALELDPVPAGVQSSETDGPRPRARRHSRVLLLVSGGAVLAIAVSILVLGSFGSPFKDGSVTATSAAPPLPLTWEMRRREARDAKIQEEREKQKSNLIEQSQRLASKGKGLRGGTLEPEALERGIRAAERAATQAQAENFTAAGKSLEASKRLILKAERQPIPPPVVPESPVTTTPFDISGSSSSGSSSSGSSDIQVVPGGGSIIEIP